MQSKRTPAFSVAFGGILAAVAVIIMSMGTLIPVATYVCPMLCCLILQLVGNVCGDRMGWAWYGAVAVLSILLAPDKEAAAVFTAIGYYPIVKPKLDRRKGKWLWKVVLFNGSIVLMYWLLMHLFGMDQLAKELSGIGFAMTAVLMFLGNMVFFLLDRLLGMKFQKRK